MTLYIELQDQNIVPVAIIVSLDLITVGLYHIFFVKIQLIQYCRLCMVKSMYW